MAAAKKGGGNTVQGELRKRLEDLLKQPDNQICADCPERGPRWASATLGTFICIKCSGIHRNLGVHISFVRSVNLDEWKVEHVEQMERWGNGRARAYYEAEVPRTYMKPSDWNNVREMTRWIKDKYEFKRFLPRDGSVPDKAATGSESSPTGSGVDTEPTSRRERKPRDRGNNSTNNTSSSVSSAQDGRLGAPKPTVANQVRLKPAESKPQAAVDLLDFSEPVVTTPPPPASRTPPPQQAPVTSQVQAVTDQFAAFGMQPQMQPQAQAQATPVPPTPPLEMTSAGKPKLSTEQLLSMFSAPPPMAPQMPPQMANNAAWGMGAPPPSYPSYPQQMGGYSMPNPGYPQAPPQQMPMQQQGVPYGGQQPQQQPAMGGYPNMNMPPQQQAPQPQAPYGGTPGGYGAPQQPGMYPPQQQPQQPQYYGGYPPMGYPGQANPNYQQQPYR